MKALARGLLVALLLSGIASGAVAAWWTVDRTVDAPEFTVTTLDNETFRLSEHRGQVVVLDFIATWCASCAITAAELRDVYPEWDPDRVRVLAVGIDPTETEDQLRNYATEQGLPWDVARDTDRVAERYGVWELNRVIIVNPEGRIAYSKAGLMDADEFRTGVAAAANDPSSLMAIPKLGIVSLAVLAGAATFFSPCAIALLPAYLTLNLDPVPGVQSVRRRLGAGGRASLGLLVVLLSIAGSLLAVGSVARTVVPLFPPLVGVLLVGLGLAAMAKPQVFAWASRLPAIGATTSDTGVASGTRHFWYGIGYGACASGCLLPVLLQLGLTAALAGPLVGGTALAVYAATAALLMVLFSVATLAVPRRALQALTRWTRFVPTFAGAIFVFVGMYLLYYYWRASAVLG